MLIKNSVFLLLLLCPLLLHAEEEKQTKGIYKIITPGGTPVFTDRKPREDQQVEKVIPQELQSMPVAPIDEHFAEPDAILKEYNVFKITAPEQNETLHNVDNLIVTTQVQPPLFPGDSIALLMNGKVIEASTKNNHIAVTLPGRGSYSFVGKIYNQEQQLLKTTSPITVHIKKHSVLFK